MRRVLGWVRDYPWAVSAFLLGILVGAALKLPLLPYVLPEGAANLIGAALGAGIAVWGAAWMVEHKERSRARKARDAIQRTVLPIELPVTQLMGTVQKVRDDVQPGDFDQLLERAGAVIDACKLLKIRTKALKPLFLELGPSGVVAYIELKRRIDLLLELAGSVEGKLAYKGDTLRTLMQDLSAKLHSELVGITSNARAA